MPRKILLGYICGALFLAGCAVVKEKAPAAVPAPAVPVKAPRAVPPQAGAAPKTRALSGLAPQKPQTVAAVPNRADLPAMIGAGASWTSPGFQSLTVKRGGSPVQQPVPIFRQAGTLATVRAALADSPARPQAEFLNGVLTLNFDRGSNEEIASAVNKTLSVTGTRNLQDVLQP